MNFNVDKLIDKLTPKNITNKITSYSIGGVPAITYGFLGITVILLSTVHFMSNDTDSSTASSAQEPSSSEKQDEPEPANESEPEPVKESEPEPAKESEPEPAKESEPEPAIESEPNAMNDSEISNDKPESYEDIPEERKKEQEEDVYGGSALDGGALDGGALDGGIKRRKKSKSKKSKLSRKKTLRKNKKQKKGRVQIKEISPKVSSFVQK
jgi:hypothetical protein